jgi:hypothetical protein
MKRLNGWQRIYVLLSCGWLVYCIAFDLEILPTENSYRGVVRARALQEVPEALVNRQAMADCIEQRRRIGGTSPPGECEAAGVAGVKPEDQQRYDAIIAKGDAEMGDMLLREHVKLTGVILGAWLGGSLAFYFCAWALHRVLWWVVAGFRRPAP